MPLGGKGGPVGKVALAVLRITVVIPRLISQAKYKELGA